MQENKHFIGCLAVFFIFIAIAFIFIKQEYSPNSENRVFCIDKDKLESIDGNIERKSVSGYGFSLSIFPTL